MNLKHGKTWEETSIQAVSIVKSVENEPTSHLFHRKKIPLQLDAVVTVPCTGVLRQHCQMLENTWIHVGCWDKDICVWIKLG